MIIVIPDIYNIAYREFLLYGKRSFVTLGGSYYVKWSLNPYLMPCRGISWRRIWKPNHVHRFFANAQNDKCYYVPPEVTKNLSLLVSNSWYRNPFSITPSRNYFSWRRFWKTWRRLVCLLSVYIMVYMHFLLVLQ